MRSLVLPLVLALTIPVATAQKRAPSAALTSADPELLLTEMSLKDKVGQVLMVTAGGARLGRSARRFLRRIRPGGIALFGYHLGGGPRQIRRLTEDLRRAVGPIPPLVAVDHEGGPVVRIRRGMPRLPANRIFGIAADPALSERAGRLVGAALAGLGFNLNLAPVLDVPRGRTGRYLRRRALGVGPALVARLGAAYLRGLRAAGVVGVAKHFPGEGSSRGDPHRRLPVASASGRVLRKVDLVPFREAGAEAVMVGHVVYPALDPLRRPASLSPPVYRLLREEVGFSGLVLTDGLEMRGIRRRHDVGHAAVAALRAGADMVSIFWSPRQIQRARLAIVRAIRSGRLPRERLDEAVRHVLGAKRRWGVLGLQRSLPNRSAAAGRSAALPATAPPCSSAMPARAFRCPQAHRVVQRALGVLRNDLGKAVARVVRGASLWPLPVGTVVLSRNAEVLRVAGERGIDLGRVSLRVARRRARDAGVAVLVGRRVVRSLRSALRRLGVRVVAVVARTPRRAQRLGADAVVTAWDRDLLAGALAVVLGPGAPKSWVSTSAAGSGRGFTVAERR